MTSYNYLFVYIIKYCIFVRNEEKGLSLTVFQACLIATPTFTHEWYILGSLGAGLSVFSEKPIAEDPRSTVRCYQKAEQVRLEGKKSGTPGNIDNTQLTFRLVNHFFVRSTEDLTRLLPP